jgi:hypothetical protein
VRTNYVFLDLENVQPRSLEQVANEHFKLFVFVGASQTKLPFEIAAFLQRQGSRAEYIKISGNGSNALDFHIAYYIGRLAASDPTAYFHIISKDTGFDPLIQHLRSKKILAGRVKSISEIPIIKALNAKSPAERLDVALARLQQLKACRPGSVKTLSSTIASLFQEQLSEDEVAVVIEELANQGYIAIAGAKITYALPGDG